MIRYFWLALYLVECFTLGVRADVLGPARLILCFVMWTWMFFDFSSPQSGRIAR